MQMYHILSIFCWKIELTENKHEHCETYVCNFLTFAANRCISIHLNTYSIHLQFEAHEHARAGVSVLVSAAPISVYQRVLMGHIKASGSIK